MQGTQFLEISLFKLAFKKREEDIEEQGFIKVHNVIAHLVDDAAQDRLCAIAVALSTGKTKGLGLDGLDFKSKADFCAFFSTPFANF